MDDDTQAMLNKGDASESDGPGMEKSYGDESHNLSRPDCKGSCAPMTKDSLSILGAGQAYKSIPDQVK